MPPTYIRFNYELCSKNKKSITESLSVYTIFTNALWRFLIKWLKFILYLSSNGTKVLWGTFRQNLTEFFIFIFYFMMNSMYLDPNLCTILNVHLHKVILHVCRNATRLVNYNCNIVVRFFANSDTWEIFIK